LKEEEFN